MRTLALVILLVAPAFVGCGPSLHVREDIYRSQPIWESSTLTRDRARSQEARAVAPRPPPGAGLTALEAQVLGREAPATAAPRALAASRVFAADDGNPLPHALASLDVTKAIVESAGRACRGERVPDRALSTRQLRKFGETMLTETLGAYQDLDRIEPGRLARIAWFVQKGEINWEGLAWAYFSAYYEGNFVDRTGGKLSKPSIGLKIPNETITSALTVGIESLFDYALLSCEVRNPIVFRVEKGTPVDAPIPWGQIRFETKDHAVPTLVGVIQRALGQPDPESDTPKDHPPLMTLAYALEPIQRDESKEGITPIKLKWIRFLSGIAAESGGAASDLIVRSIGGAGGAFVAFGKLSIGDNDTLSKVVQTVVDVSVRRATEASVADRLYGITRRDGGPVPMLQKAEDWPTALLGYGAPAMEESR